MNDSISKIEARRIALTAQGFAEPRPTEAGHSDLRGVIDRLGLIQLDSVNVCVRAHYMPFFSRLGKYPIELLGDGCHERFGLFEFWGHVASLIPVEQYPLFRHRMDDGIKRRSRTLRSADPENVLIIDTSADDRIIAETDRLRAQTSVHEGAIYMVESQPYQVDRLDWHQKKAYVRRVSVDHFTTAMSYSKVRIIDTYCAQPRASGGTRAHGRRDAWVSDRRVRPGQHRPEVCSHLDERRADGRGAS